MAGNFKTVKIEIYDLFQKGEFDCFIHSDNSNRTGNKVITGTVRHTEIDISNKKDGYGSCLIFSLAVNSSNRALKQCLRKMKKIIKEEFSYIPLEGGKKLVFKPENVKLGIKYPGLVINDESLEIIKSELAEYDVTIGNERTNNSEEAGLQHSFWTTLE